MRRLVILALLFGGIQLVLFAGPAEGSGEALLAFGFLILAAYSMGELAKQFNQPKIVVCVLQFHPQIRLNEALDHANHDRGDMFGVARFAKLHRSLEGGWRAAF